MNRQQLRDRLGFRLNFNDSQVDQGFTTSRLNDLLQDAYNREVELGKTHGGAVWFKKTMDVTWPSGDTTFALPASLLSNTILTVYEVLDSGTANERLGSRIIFSEQFQGGSSSFMNDSYPGSASLATIFWKDNKTLQWGNTSGPDSDKDLRFTYVGSAERLDADNEEPQLIPAQLHELIILSAACEAREIADEQCPQGWYARRDELRMDYVKFISQGRPAGTNTWFGSSQPYPYS